MGTAHRQVGTLPADQRQVYFTIIISHESQACLPGLLEWCMVEVDWHFVYFSKLISDHSDLSCSRYVGHCVAPIPSHEVIS